MRIFISRILFQVFYSLITFGVSLDPLVTSPLDPPNHLFRIRLVCILLETCGRYKVNWAPFQYKTVFNTLAGTYFSSGSSKKRLDYYLTFLQGYYWFKKTHWGDSFPPFLDHIFKETILTLRPKLKLCRSYEDAQKEVENIRVSLGIGKLNTSESFFYLDCCAF